ncbi:MAG: metallophosphoesterase family protein [Clostridia bacterium]|nr:metallophosphoesterase family protein [Clostridia bacterium]
MKKLLLLASLLLCGASAFCQGLQWGPWVTETRENSLSILWVSEQPGMAWVELEDGSRIWETFAGRRVFGRLHKIHLQNLQPGATVKYRVGGENLKDDSNARKPKFETGYVDKWERVKTFDAGAPACRFSVFNDIHLRTGEYKALASQVDPATTDFLFLNGDIATAGNYVLDTLVKYELWPLGELAATHPVLFGRGNHEGRGNNVQLVADIFPNGDPAPFYYTFRQGPVAFVVFDGGETGHDRSILFSGSAVYEEYLKEQLEWARKALLDPSFFYAPVKICLLHVPMIDHEDKTDYLLQRWLNVHFMELLNQVGLDLMIGADLHEFMYCEPGTMGNSFPIMVNDDARRLDVFSDGNAITLHMRNAKGELEFEKSIAL